MCGIAAFLSRRGPVPVLGLAAKHHRLLIRAFTLTFDRADYDGEREAKEMAASVGAEFFPIRIRQDDLADHFADAIAQSETLCVNARFPGAIPSGGVKAHTSCTMKDKEALYLYP